MTTIPAPATFGCRWCGADKDGHGWRPDERVGSHQWERPTAEQMKVRKAARRGQTNHKGRS